VGQSSQDRRVEREGSAGSTTQALRRRRRRRRPLGGGGERLGVGVGRRRGAEVGESLLYREYTGLQSNLAYTLYPTLLSPLIGSIDNESAMLSSYRHIRDGGASRSRHSRDPSCAPSGPSCGRVWPVGGPPLAPPVPWGSSRTEFDARRLRVPSKHVVHACYAVIAYLMLRVADCATASAKSA
jgi:hypothetical protein